MKKLIKIYFVVVALLSVACVVLFAVNIMVSNKKVSTSIKNNEEETKIISTTEKEFKRGKLVKEYTDADGVITREYSNGSVLAEFPDDVSTWTMSNKDMREEIIQEALWGRDLNLRDYPITDNYFKEYTEKGWIELEVLFPGFEFSRYNRHGSFGFYIDDFEKTDKEGMAHATVRCKYNKVRYDFKYYLTNDYKLDSIDYIGKEIVEDFSEQVAIDERTYLMIKDGDGIHQNDEYRTVLWNISDSILNSDFSLDDMGIRTELKEKKYNDNVLPISNDVKYISFCSKDGTDYNDKRAVIYVKYIDSNTYEKFTIRFDYDRNYYLSEYIVLDSSNISKDEYDKEFNNSVIRF